MSINVLTSQPLNLPDNQDDYYALQREISQKKVHVQLVSHRNSVREELKRLIPYYNESLPEERDLLVRLNDFLIHQFKGPGLLYWRIFCQKPNEIYEYTDILKDDFTSGEIQQLVDLLETKLQEHSYEVEEEEAETIF